MASLYKTSTHQPQDPSALSSFCSFFYAPLYFSRWCGARVPLWLRPLLCFTSLYIINISDGTKHICTFFATLHVFICVAYLYSYFLNIWHSFRREVTSSIDHFFIRPSICMFECLSDTTPQSSYWFFQVFHAYTYVASMNLQIICRFAQNFVISFTDMHVLGQPFWRN